MLSTAIIVALTFWISPGVIFLFCALLFMPEERSLKTLYEHIATLFLGPVLIYTLMKGF